MPANVGVRRRTPSVRVFAAGDEEAGSADRASAWEGLEQGEVGRRWALRRDGVVTVLDRVPGDPEWADEGLHEQRQGGDDARIGRPGGGSL